MQLVEQERALGHDLPDERLRVERLLAEERAEARAAQVERLARFLGAGVGRVAAGDLEPFGAEGLAQRFD